MDVVKGARTVTLERRICPFILPPFRPLRASILLRVTSARAG